MKSNEKTHALVGIDPTIDEHGTPDSFLKVLRRFQDVSLIPSFSFVGIMHAHLYPMPNQFYRESKSKLKNEAEKRIDSLVSKTFPTSSVSILQSNSPAKEDHVSLLSKWGAKLGVEFLVLASQDRKGLPYWLLGSFAETASLTSKLPVLIVKPESSPNHFAAPVSMVVCVDVASPPAAASLATVARVAKRANASVHYVYVRPKKRTFTDALFQRKSENETQSLLSRLKTSMESKALNVTATVLEEKDSIAHSLEEFATSRKAWLIVTTAPKRSHARKLFLGSTARKLLAVTKHPVLNLRSE